VIIRTSEYFRGMSAIGPGALKGELAEPLDICGEVVDGAGPSPKSSDSEESWRRRRLEAMPSSNTTSDTSGAYIFEYVDMLNFHLNRGASLVDRDMM
jgi:hypothetical protein